MDEMIFVVI